MYVNSDMHIFIYNHRYFYYQSNPKFYCRNQRSALQYYFMKLLIQFIVFIMNVSSVSELYTLRRLHKERFFVCLQGDYRVDAKITDTNTGEEVACYHVEVSATQPPCSGFLCNIFG